MNKKLMSTLLVLCFPLTAFALQPQLGVSGLPDKGQKIERMSKELGLSDDQKAKIGAIFDEQKMKYKALQDEKRTRLQGVLTQEQMAKFDKIRQQIRHKLAGIGTSDDKPQ